MLSERVQVGLSQQLNLELSAAYLYTSMAAFFAAQDLPGFANWMKIQVQEELFHGSKFFDFVHERGGQVNLETIVAPRSEWRSVVEVFQQVIAEEEGVTRSINALVDLALAEKDYATQGFLQWFVTEQIEEEAAATAVLRRLKLAGETGPGLFMLDAELAKRVLNLPVSGGNASA